MDACEQYGLLIRMDENIKAIQEKLKDETEKFNEIHRSVIELNLKLVGHENMMAEHPVMCAGIANIKLDLSNHIAREKGMTKGLSVTAVILVGILNIIFMIMEIFKI